MKNKYNQATISNMAASEIEAKRWQTIVSNFIEKIRPEARIRPQLDYGFKLKGQSIEIYSIRPGFQNPKEIMQSGFAKATFVKSEKIWKIYWMRASLKWERYGAHPTANSIEEWLDVVEEDKHGCFFG